MDISALLGVERGVTALIGGGGKTTLMCTLAEELRRRGTVVVTTSTHIQRPEQYPVLLSGGAAAVSAALAAHGAVCVAGETAEGKLTAPALSFETLAQLADFVLVEADGAKRLPLKAHAPHEPVIPPNTRQTIYVVGADGFGRPIRQICHRPERYAALCGAAAGFITGTLHTRCGIPAILAGILTQLALYSVNLRIMGGKANQAVSVDKYDLLLSQRYVRTLSLDNPLPLLIVLTVVIVAALYWFFGTEKGNSVRATGANPHMARAQGINTNANIVLGLMLSNGLVALAGALLAQYQGSSDINMGRGAIVIGLAAVIIGEVIFGKLFHNIGAKLLAVSVGAIVYYIVLQVVLQIGLNTNDLKLITALIVAIFLTLSYLNLKKTRRKPKAQHTAKEGVEQHA